MLAGSPSSSIAALLRNGRMRPWLSTARAIVSEEEDAAEPALLEGPAGMSIESGSVVAGGADEDAEDVDGLASMLSVGARWQFRKTDVEG